jgi:hypothetical protein
MTTFKGQENEVWLPIYLMCRCPGCLPLGHQILMVDPGGLWIALTVVGVSLTGSRECNIPFTVFALGVAGAAVEGLASVAVLVDHHSQFQYLQKVHDVVAVAPGSAGTVLHQSVNVLPRVQV